MDGRFRLLFISYGNANKIIKVMAAVIIILVMLIFSILLIIKVNKKDSYQRVSKNIIIFLIIFAFITLSIILSIWQFVDLPEIPGM